MQQNELRAMCTGEMHVRERKKQDMENAYTNTRTYTCTRMYIEINLHLYICIYVLVPIRMQHALATLCRAWQVSYPVKDSARVQKDE